MQLVKVDTATKKRLEWNERHCYPSEPIFVPSPGAKVTNQMDSGVLAGFIARF